MPKEPEHSARESALAKGWVVEGSDEASIEASSTHAALNDAPESESAKEVLSAPEADAEYSGSGQLSNAMIVLLGIIGGLYLIYVWIWFSWADFVASASGPGLPYMQGSLGAGIQLTLYRLVPLAPVLWFITVVLAHRGKPRGRLTLWLIIGAVLLVPLPYFFWGA